MEDYSQPPINDEEKKRRDRAEYEAFFAKEREKEIAQTRTSIIWVAVIGGGMTFLFFVFYIFLSFFSAFA